MRQYDVTYIRISYLYKIFYKILYEFRLYLTLSIKFLFVGILKKKSCGSILNYVSWFFLLCYWFFILNYVNWFFYYYVIGFFIWFFYWLFKVDLVAIQDLFSHKNNVTEYIISLFCDVYLHKTMFETLFYKSRKY